MKRYIAALLALALALTCVLSACSGTKDSGTTTAAATTAATTAAGTTTAAATTAAATTAAATTAPATEAPAQITMFMTNAGIDLPEGVDANDNPYFNYIKELANVEVTELIIPPYTDFATKLQLMLSSGNLTDVVHGSFYSADINKVGGDGAFIDMEPVVRNSATLSTKYTDGMLDMMRYNDGHIYALRTMPSADVDCLGIRLDLLNELNDGVIPTTLDEWHDVLVKEKETYPDSVPLTDMGGTCEVAVIYTAFGVSIGNWQYTDGKYISCFEAPHQKDALLYVKSLYDDGLLSKTFVTNTLEDYKNDKFNNRAMIQSNNLGAVLNYVAHYTDPNQYTGDDTVIFVPTPYIEAVYDDVDPCVAIKKRGALGSHCIAISAASKEQDACIRLVEALASDEAATVCAWGLEGIDYTLDGDTKVPTEAATESSYKVMYGFMFTYWSTETIMARLPGYFANVDESIKDSYYEKVLEGMQSVYDRADELPETIPSDYVTITDEDVNVRITEAHEEAMSLILKTIVGEMSIEDYDAGVAAFLEKYADVTQAYNDALTAAAEQYGF